MYLKKDIYFFLKEKEVISFKKLFSYLAYNISSSINISKLSSYL
jgi:predicted AAA+ superfamily ATPase